MRKTQYERLQEKYDQLVERRDQVRRDAQTWHDEAVARVSAGSKPPKARHDFSSEITLLDNALATVTEEMRDPNVRRAHVEAKTVQIEREREAMRQEAAPVIGNVDRAAQKLREAESEREVLQYRHEGKHEELSRREAALRALSVNEEGADNVIADTSEVERYLHALREGSMRSVIRGVDAALDAALVTYEREVEEIAQWGHRSRLDMRTTGKAGGPPDCARFYSSGRLQELAHRRASSPVSSGRGEIARRGQRHDATVSMGVARKKRAI